MQEPIRYYITKSGEEPTVRSVRVAQGAHDPDGGAETPTATGAEPTTANRHVPTPPTDAKRRVTDALRRRQSNE